MKKVVLSLFLSVVASSNLFSSDFCDKSKVEKILSTPIKSGGKVLEMEPSKDLAGFCDVYFLYNGKVDLLYMDLKKNEFLTNALLVSYDEKRNEYSPKKIEKITKMNSLINDEKYNKAISMLSDDKKLEEYFNLGITLDSKKDSKSHINTQYEILIFESLICSFCNELNSLFKETYKDKNIRLTKYYLPLNKEDYNNLKDNYYKDEKKLKKAIDLKQELGIDGVPVVVVRDAKTKKFVRLIQSPTVPANFEEIKSYVK